MLSISPPSPREGSAARGAPLRAGTEAATALCKAVRIAEARLPKPHGCGVLTHASNTCTTRDVHGGSNGTKSCPC